MQYVEMQGAVPYMVADQHDHLPACLLHLCLVSRKRHPYMPIKPNWRFLNPVNPHATTLLIRLVKQSFFIVSQQQPASPVVMLICSTWHIRTDHGVAIDTLPHLFTFECIG